MKKKNPNMKYAYLRFAGLALAVVSVIALVLVLILVKPVTEFVPDDGSAHSSEEEESDTETETETGTESDTETETESYTETETETETETVTETETETEPPTEPVTAAPTEPPVVPTEPAVPPTEPSVVPTEPATQPVEPGQSVYGLRALSTAEIESIKASYSQQGKGYGSGLTPSKDGFGRPAHNAAIDAEMRSLGLSCDIFVSSPGTKKVAFMFMEGTETGYTSSVMDILRDKNVKASFYVTHFYAKSWPQLVQRMIGEGHELGSHTYESPGGGIVGKPFEYQLNDALKMQKYIGDTFGYSMKRYNFNDGVYETATIAALERMGYKSVVFGSVQYDDWNQQKVFDVNDTLSKLEAALHDGCIYSFHSTNVITVQVLPALIDHCRAAGYEIVNLP